MTFREKQTAKRWINVYNVDLVTIARFHGITKKELEKQLNAFN